MAKLGIIGAKNSGKTTLIEQLIPIFVASGLQVNSIKHTAHNHSFDTPGKDSHRHRVAGTSMTLTVSSSELALFGQSQTKLQSELEELIEHNSDLCLIEGNKHSNDPKILLTRNINQISPEEITNIVATYGPDGSNLSSTHIPLDDTNQVAEFAIKLFSLKPKGDNSNA